MSLKIELNYVYRDANEKQFIFDRLKDRTKNLMQYYKQYKYVYYLITYLSF